MYLAVDIGGSKTLFAVFTHDGKLLTQHKTVTNPDYKKFLKDVEEVLRGELKAYDFKYCCCAIPGMVDRKNGIGVRFGNLKWHNVPLMDDLRKILDGVPVLLEHDSNLGGLSEAIQLHGKYKRVLYLTISTGIGNGLIINDKISVDITDSEAGHMVIEHEGQLKKWEDFASGRALKERYGKLASEIDDPKIWKEFARNIALGLSELIAVLQPDAVVIGGGVGTHLEKFGDLLNNELEALENTMIKTPPVIKAKRPEEAVIYGCYELIKQHN